MTGKALHRRLYTSYIFLSYACFMENSVW